MSPSQSVVVQVTGVPLAVTPVAPTSEHGDPWRTNAWPGGPPPGSGVTGGPDGGGAGSSVVDTVGGTELADARVVEGVV